jgi:hypothetical protein
LFIDLRKESELSILAQFELLAKVGNDILWVLAFIDFDVLNVSATVKFDLENTDGIIFFEEHLA